MNSTCCHGNRPSFAKDRRLCPGFGPGNARTRAFPEAEEAHTAVLRSLMALVMTDTELKLMAAAAIMGESTIPKTG